MLPVLIGRILSALVVVLGVITIVFLFIHLIPGDPVDVMLGCLLYTSDAADEN